MNNRQKRIIRELLKRDLSTAELASICEVTPRTIRNDIKDINIELAKNGAEIIKLDNRKQSIKINNQESYNKYIRNNLYTNELNYSDPESRIIYVALKLLFSSDYVKLDDIADELYISRSTLQNDFKEVKKMMLKYNILTEFKPNYGIKAVGDEKDIRKAISQIINNQEINSQSFLSFNSNLISYSKEEWDKIYEILIENISNSKIVLSDISLNNLIIHIAIVLKRIENNHYINKNIENNFISSYEYDIAQDIVFDIEDEFNVEFPQEEVYYITMHLMGINLTLDNISTLGVKSNEDLTNIAIELIESMEKQLSVNLLDDEELLYGIIMHLRPAVHRYKNRMNIRNPLLSSIKQNYPYTFESVKFASKIVEKRLNIEFNEDEIGYLTIHFGAAIERNKLKTESIRTLVVCTAGIGSSQILRYKLEQKFSGLLDIIKVSELYNIKNISENEYDLIISTVPINAKMNVPVIVVEDILDNSKYTEVSNFIMGYNKNQKITYLEKENIYLSLKSESKEEVIKYMCNRLVEQEKAPKELYDSVMARENVISTAYGNLVAIPHPIELLTKKTFLSLATLEKPIEWGDKEIQLVILINVSKDDKENLKKMYNFIVDTIDDYDKVKKMISSKSINLIYNMMNP